MIGALTPEQMRNAEAASERLGVSLRQLMQNAGGRLAEHVALRAKELGARRIFLLCGTGNNGGDGFVCAADLAKHGLEAEVCLVCGEPKSELAVRAFGLLKDGGIAVHSGLPNTSRDADIIVDCIFGTGFHGEFDDSCKGTLDMLSESRAYKIACDMPSGVDCLRGTAAEGTMRFDETVTFHAKKLGCCLKPAKAYCGRVTVCDIGIPDGWDRYCADGTVISEMLPEQLHALMPIRPEHSHKGTFGRLQLICGSASYIGAAAIASRAALRTGCGIVELAAPAAVIQAIAGFAPECVYTPIPADEDGFISAAALPELLGHAESCTAVVVGCGIGRTEGTKAIVEGLVKNVKKPLVIDADGINQLAKNIDVLRDRNCETILTPHIGELGRLCGVTTTQALSDRYALCHELAGKYGITLHSKDSTSLTFWDKHCAVTDFGCSALAKGGSGDMLAGVIGSMLAQGKLPHEACMLGDYIVGRTAELLCEGSSPAAVTASDMIAEFKHTLTVL